MEMAASRSAPTLNPMRLARRAFGRLFGRDVMLYTGGVSFYAALAGAPALAILVSFYSLILTPQIAARQAAQLSLLLPGGAQQLFADELQRLASAPLSLAGTQGVVALVITLYAALRGAKALIAGLSFINEDKDSHSFLEFNLMALLVFLAGVALILVSSTAFLIVRVVVMALAPAAGAHMGSILLQWLWAGVGQAAGLTLMYRYVMAVRPLPWRASAAGGITGAAVTLTASWLCAFYVDRVARFGATYGSIAAVVVLLIWISWNVNAVFYGGALATEIDLVLNADPEEPAMTAL